MADGNHWYRTDPLFELSALAAPILVSIMDDERRPLPELAVEKLVGAE